MRYFLFVALCSVAALGHPHGSLRNPEERDDLFEGDILLEAGDQDARNGIISASRMWTGGRVPYSIVGSFTSTQLATFRRAVAEYTEKTCVRFVEKTTSDTAYIRIQNSQSGCFANVGKLTSGNPNTINFDNWCFNRYGTIVHEMAHALGFYHEQSRFDRDDFVVIDYNNIKTSSKHNFNKYTNTQVQHFGAPYDYDSMMHYSATAFSINGKKTIITKDPNANIGQRTGFSVSDLYKINNMYKCGEKGYDVTLPPDITWPATPWPEPVVPTVPPTTVSGTEWSCTFVSSRMCGFKVVSSNALNWIWQKGSTPSGNTGPTGTHTGSLTSYYMFLETSYGSIGDEAILRSPAFTTAGNRCITFWYHMYGATMGTLRLIAELGDRKTQLFTAAGSKGDRWYKAQMSHNFASMTQLAFEGTRGASYTGDMAIDDISIEGGPCATTTADPAVATTALPGNIFGKPEGFYVHVEASFMNENKEARLKSTEFVTRSTSTCVSFYYHMWDGMRDHMGTLTVVARDEESGAGEMNVFKKGGDQGNKWFKFETALQTAANHKYTLRFRGAKSNGFAGDMAVDEILVTDGAC